MEQVLQKFGEQIRAASAAGTPLRLRGGGTKDWYGQQLQGDVLDTSGYRGVVEYDPTELVITARCGTPLSELEAVLAQKNQMLAFEPPHFGSGATVGGMVAAGLSGPRRQAVGSVRDFVLGSVLMDSTGELLHFGGQVMKNVAGYDVSRLLAGSMGTLGLVVEVSLKVLPRPFVETSVRMAMTSSEAIRRLNEWGGQPLPISASVWHDDTLTVRLSGANAAVQSARTRLGGEVLDESEALAFWADVREQKLPFFQAEGAGPLWRLSLPSVTPPLDIMNEPAEAQLIEWGGALRWLRSNVPADAIRQAAQRAGGHATLFHGGDKQLGVFQPLTAAIHVIHRNLKRSFDPAGIFNVGRLYNDF